MNRFYPLRKKKLKLSLGTAIILYIKTFAVHKCPKQFLNNHSINIIILL